jgi:L-lactate permease
MKNNFKVFYYKNSQDPLLELTTRLTEGPFGPDQTEEATQLINKDVLCAQKESHLGYYGKLISVNSDLAEPYLVKMKTKDGQLSRFKWVVRND